ncbi:MAG: hypothetical protein ACFFCV_06905 [Promethearchaeota archaeon]
MKKIECYVCKKIKSEGKCKDIPLEYIKSVPEPVVNGLIEEIGLV